MIRPGTILILCTLAAASGAANDRVDFARSVRPLLVNHCYECHGPDKAARKAGLRLDRPEAFSQPLPSGNQAIVPGQPERSKLLDRVKSLVADERMPPRDKKPLNADQIALLQRWISQGARADEHWAFQRIRRPSIPKTKGTWERNPIDAFIMQRLQVEGLRPSPAADERTLIRRLSLLTRGLPPTQEEMRLALRDGIDRYTDRLLASPAFGERQAQNWLDAARYADTTGHAADAPRTMWLYRDWVVDALNADMPYDQFTIEQLAGDMLSPPTTSQLIATGFHRNSPQALGNNPRKEEFRVKGIVDRVATTGRVWLGMSLGCAECHDHKYDPISTREYYQLFALFNNVPHYGDRFEVHGPRIQVLPKRTRQELKDVDRQVARLQQQIDRLASRPGFKSRLKKRIASVKPLQRLPQPAIHLIPVDCQSLSIDQQLEKGARSFKRQPLAVADKNPALTGPLTVSAWVKTKQPVGNIASNYDWRGRQRSFVFGIGGEAETDAPPGTLFVWLSSATDTFRGITVYSGRRINDDRWHHVAFSFAPGKYAQLFVDGKLETNVKVQGKPPEKLAISDRGLIIAAGYSNSRRPNAYFLEGKLADVRIHRTSIRDMRLTGFARTERFVRDEMLANDPHTGPLIAQRQALEKKRKRLRAGTVTAQVMAEMPKQRATHIHVRGNFENPGPRVSPGVPAALQAPGTKPIENRLQFARWLIDRRHPLTARVAVNRIWQHYFHHGIVRTPDDFGTRGARPTHPQLLDWLASELIDSGWSRKHIHRLILHSATFRQTSRQSKTLRSRDPDNRWLVRFPRRRASAETIRDSVLQVSGLLEREIGGRSVYPFQPPGVGMFRDKTAGEWKTDPEAKANRRGLYVFWQRMSPYPSMTLFDASSREVCLVKRSLTNTPLQALAQLNDPVIAAAAKALAERVYRSAGNDNDRLQTLFELVLCRPPSHQERKQFQQFLALVRSESRQREPHLAWYHLATVMLNLDEALTIE